MSNDPLDGKPYRADPEVRKRQRKEYLQYAIGLTILIGAFLLTRAIEWLRISDLFYAYLVGFFVLGYAKQIIGSQIEKRKIPGIHKYYAPVNVYFSDLREIVGVLEKLSRTSRSDEKDGRVVQVISSDSRVTSLESLAEVSYSNGFFPHALYLEAPSKDFSVIIGATSTDGALATVTKVYTKGESDAELAAFQSIDSILKNRETSKVLLFSYNYAVPLLAVAGMDFAMAELLELIPLPHWGEFLIWMVAAGLFGWAHLSLTPNRFIDSIYTTEKE